MKKNMSNMEMGGKCEGGCCSYGTHTCSKCTPFVVVFGLLFLIAGLGLLSSWMWFNGWTILGAFLVLLGVGSKMM